MIYFFGDTHGTIDMLKIFKFDYEKDDHIVILGDFGLLWANTKDKTEKMAEKYLNELPCDVLFIDGNHENFNRLDALPQVHKYGDFVGDYSQNIFHLKRGRIYEIEGTKFFTMGGALSIDKAWRKENKSWWSGENISDEQLNLGLENIAKAGNIDIILTHTLPTSVVEILRQKMEMLEIFDKNSAKLEQIFDALKQRRFALKAWIFGHWHIDIFFNMPYLQNELSFCGLYNEKALVLDDEKELRVVEIE